MFVWPVSNATSGWEWTGDIPDYFAEDKVNFQEPFCGLVPSTQHAAVCTLFSYTYRVYDWADTTYRGWYPAPPDSLGWGLTVLGRFTASVPEDWDEGVAERPRLVSVLPRPGGKALITFHLPRAEHVVLNVFDVRGRDIRTILDERREAAVHRVEWDGRDDFGKRVAPGVYLYRMVAGDRHDVRKAVLVR